MLPPSFHYAREKFGNAATLLATGKEDIKPRLKRAAFEILAVSIVGLPDELQSDINWIREQLKKRGTLDNTILTMHRKTGGKIAQRIYEVSERLDALVD
jgi:hypothetical protein